MNFVVVGQAMLVYFVAIDRGPAAGQVAAAELGVVAVEKFDIAGQLGEQSAVVSGLAEKPVAVAALAESVAVAAELVVGNSVELLVGLAERTEAVVAEQQTVADQAGVDRNTAAVEDTEPVVHNAVAAQTEAVVHIVAVAF